MVGRGAGSVIRAFSAMNAASQATASRTLLSSKNALSNYRLILASKSPRRREIFDLMGLNEVGYEVMVSDFAEDLDKSKFEGAAVSQLHCFAKSEM